MTITTGQDAAAPSPDPAVTVQALPSPERQAPRAPRGGVRRFFMRPRRILVRAHRWVSFALLAWVAVISLTGGWLVFNDLYGSWLQPELYERSSGDVGVQAAIDSVTEEIPDDGYIAYVVTPTNGRGVYQVDGAWPDPDSPPPASEDEYPAEIYRTYYVDPGTGEVNGSRGEDGFTSWAYRGHMYLWQDHGLLGVFDPDEGWCRLGADGHEPGGAKGAVCDGLPDGEDFVAWLALAWIVVLFTGFYLWYWPGVRRWATALVVKRGRGTFAFNLSLHRVIGLIFWGPLVVIAFTGMAFAFPNMKGWYENATPAGRGAELWLPPEDVASTPIDGTEPMDADEFVAAFEERFPERTFISIAGFPADEAGTWQAWVDRGYTTWTREGSGGNTLVVMDQYSGAVLYDGSPEDGNVFEQAWSDWSFPVHAGDFAGTTSRVAWTAVSLAPVVLGTTGLVMWLVRRSKRRRAFERAAARAATGVAA